MVAPARSLLPACSSAGLVVGSASVTHVFVSHLPTSCAASANDCQILEGEET